MLAVDLSMTSLAYAKRKTQELAIGNIEYRQADILALGSIAERFDVVECMGVLHHLEDPVAGSRILCSLLRPAGLMRIGLYSEIARRHVVRARELSRRRASRRRPSAYAHAARRSSRGGTTSGSRASPGARISTA